MVLLPKPKVPLLGKKRAKLAKKGPTLLNRQSQERASELDEAWTEYMVNGFRQNELMFQKTLSAFMKPYSLTVWLYVTLYLVGIGLFLAAVVIGLRNNNSVVAIVFAGLSVTSFLAFFVRQPLHGLEENLEFITWLGVAFNTYWTRLMYMSDANSVQAELKAAEVDFRSSIEKLIAQHAALRGKRSQLGSGDKSDSSVGSGGQVAKPNAPKA